MTHPFREFDPSAAPVPACSFCLGYAKRVALRGFDKATICDACIKLAFEIAWPSTEIPAAVWPSTEPSEDK